MLGQPILNPAKLFFTRCRACYSTAEVATRKHTTPSSTTLSPTQLSPVAVAKPAQRGPQPKPAQLEPPPPYPFGPARCFKQSDRGIYGGAQKQFGNNVSQKSQIKTRRWWKPNIQNKRLYSASLGRQVKVKVSTRVLRTIDKVGGLDEYLMGNKTARIKELGLKGWELRYQVMQTPAMQKRFKLQRRALGLPSVKTSPILPLGASTQEVDSAVPEPILDNASESLPPQQPVSAQHKKLEEVQEDLSEKSGDGAEERPWYKKLMGKPSS